MNIPAGLKKPVQLFQQGIVNFQLLRYLLAGGTTTILCWGTLLLLKEDFHVNYLLSTNISVFISYIYSYLINKHFVFKDNKKQHLQQGSKFLIVQIIIWLTANALMITGVEGLHIHYFIIIIFIFVFTVVFNYFVMKKVIFPKKDLQR